MPTHSSPPHSSPPLTSPLGSPPTARSLWPLAIALGLLAVVVVNIGFVVVAISGADEIVESYVTEER